MKDEWGTRRERAKRAEIKKNWANERMGMACEGEVWGIKREREETEGPRDKAAGC